MSKKMDIYSELDNFVEENEGQVTLTDVAKHFAEHGYQYAVEKAVEFLKEKEFGDWIEQEASSFIEDFRKAMQ